MSTPQKVRKHFSLTDSGNAELFVHQHRDKVRYCSQLGGWMIYQNGKWQADKYGVIHHLAKKTVRSLYTQAANEPDPKQRAEIVSWAKKSESRTKRRDMLDLAQNESGICVQATDFDANPFFFNCMNGTLDLRTGVLRAHSPADLLTQISQVTFDSEADCPKWMAFLSGIFNQDEDLVEFTRLLIGYSLSGDTREQCFFVGWGVGSNGKSTLLQVIRWLLGDYAAHAKTDTFTVKRSESVNNDLARLRNAHFVSAVETDEGRRLAEALIKEITGGEPITARFLFCEYFEFRPQFKVFLATNHKPEIRGTDNGIWRRVRLIPFNVKFWNPEAGEDGEPHLRADKNLLEKLREELPGILAWAVQGCLDWQRIGLTTPKAVIAATKGYQEEQDTLGQFIDACCVVGADCEASSKDLNESYRAWCENNGERAMGATALGRRFRERGFERNDQRTMRGWRGLRLKPNDERIDEFCDRF